MNDRKTSGENLLTEGKDNKLREIKIPADGRSRWCGGAFVTCFVYSKFNGNFLVTGYSDEVDKYLKENHTHYFMNIVFWCDGRNRSYWSFWKKNIGIFEPDKGKHFSGVKRQTKYKIREYSWYTTDEEEDRQQKVCVSLKRLPKRWIPEFDRF